MLANRILLAGMIVLLISRNPTQLIGIIVMSVMVLFSLITLPVEFDASKRALDGLSHTNVTNSSEYPKAKDALKGAATTYVVAALAAVVQFIRYIMIYMGSRDRNKDGEWAVVNSQCGQDQRSSSPSILDQFSN